MLVNVFLTTRSRNECINVCVPSPQLSVYLSSSVKSSVSYMYPGTSIQWLFDHYHKHILCWWKNWVFLVISQTLPHFWVNALGVCEKRTVWCTVKYLYALMLVDGYVCRACVCGLLVHLLMWRTKVGCDWFAMIMTRDVNFGVYR